MGTPIHLMVEYFPFPKFSPHPKPLLASRYTLATQGAQRFSVSQNKAPTFKFLAKSVPQDKVKFVYLIGSIGHVLRNIHS